MSTLSRNTEKQTSGNMLLNKTNKICMSIGYLMSATNDNVICVTVFPIVTVFLRMFPL